MEERHLIHGKPAERLAFLDYLRVFAFSSVLIGHKFYDQLQSLASSSPHWFIQYPLKALLPLLWGGGAGVVVFFVVSGYIIGRVLTHETPQEFLIRRFFRIYPLYVTAVIIQTAMAHHVDGKPWPPMPTLLTQLSLLGDWFHSPLTLGGVEWTLRLEVLFYAWMAVLKWAGLLDQHRRFLPAALISTTGALYLFGPTPREAFPYSNYIAVFAPFLFIGMLVLQVERKEFRKRYLAILLLAVLVRHYQATEAFRSDGFSWFATAACLLFLCAWLARPRLRPTALVILLSNMTYAVYLFHDWAWEFIKTALRSMAMPLIPIDLQVITVLFLVCYVAYRTIERGGISLGRSIARKLPRPTDRPQVGPSTAFQRLD